MKSLWALGLVVVLAARPAASQQTEFTAPPNAPDNPTKATAEIVPAVTDAERSAISITAYDLQIHLTPATSTLEGRARLTLRNETGETLRRVVLQVSSTLRWESFAGTAADGTMHPLAFGHETLETDADHTGFVSEAVVTLPAPLAPGTSTTLVGVYSGTMAHSSARLDRIGVPADQAALAEWDEVGAETTALRGFGEVLWYPVATPPVFLGDGARFFHAVAAERRRVRNASTRLRLAIAYTGEAPVAAFFRGHMEPLTAHTENADVPVAESAGIATAEFAPETLGANAMSLFVTDRPETQPEGGLIASVSANAGAASVYADAARRLQPLFTEWFGATAPSEPVLILDHAGQTFEDGALLVLPMMTSTAPEALASRLLEPLSRAWMPSSEAWVEEGLAQFSTLLWLERTAGRDAAVARLQQSAVALALAEPASGSPATPGPSLINAADEVYLRTKAAAVWWMLREIVGDDRLKATLARLHLEATHASISHSGSSPDPHQVQRILEGGSPGSLAWFFDDWVYADKGLPDLTLVQVTPRPIPTKGGKDAGWLVAVEVRNDGDAVAEVPVTVRSGTLTASTRLRIAGRSTASTRILFEKTPEEVEVNDSSVPEMRTSIHRRTLNQ